MLEAEASTVIQLTQDGTNSSDMKVMATLSMKRKQSLLSKVSLISKTDKLLERPGRMKITRNGISCILMSLVKHHPQVLARTGECTLTDHSIFNLECLMVDSWIVSPIDLLSRLEMEDQPRHSSSNTRLEPSRVRVT
jgi:hypothetical protein